MTSTFVLPAAPAPPAPAAPQAASPARETPETQAGTSFKDALATARKSDAENSADQAARSDASTKPADPAPAKGSDENTPLGQALLAAMVALASSATPTPPVVVVKDGTPPTTQPAADAAAAAALQAQTVTDADDQPAAATSAQTQAQAQNATAQAAKTAQFTDLLKAQAHPEAETKVTTEAAPAAAPQPLTPATDGSKAASAKLALEAFTSQLKPEVEKPPAAAEKPVAAPLQPLDVGQVKAAPTLNVNELARLSEARPSNPLPVVTQIQQGVETLNKTGQTSLRLQLYPDALGRVDLRLTSGADGVRVSLTADLSATGNLLERHAQELRQALSDSGLTVAGLSIGFNLGQGKSSTAFEWHPPVSGRAASSGLAQTLEPALDQIAPLGPLDSGRVDYRI